MIHKQNKNIVAIQFLRRMFRKKKEKAIVCDEERRQRQHMRWLELWMMLCMVTFDVMQSSYAYAALFFWRYLYKFIG